MLPEIEKDDVASISAAKDREGLVLIKLTADYCAPCKVYNPVLESFSENTGVPVYNLDVDKNPDIGRELGVMAIPTLLVYYDGALKDKQTGVKNEAKLKNDLAGWLPQS